MPKFTAPAHPQDPAAFLYTLTDAYLAFAEREGENGMAQLNDEQHTLLAYCYLDSQVQEGGFIQLIAAGYGEYVFMNPLADSLRRWRIKPTPKIIEQAKALYTKYGADIEALAEAEEPLENIRSRFPDFEELDGDYYEAADEDLAAAAEYVQANLDKFIE
ncbi:MAG: DMP19 family protein [Neisseria sp.]|nr:DMP19 family protein [Neisseria sp.]